MSRLARFLDQLRMGHGGLASGGLAAMCLLLAVATAHSAEPDPPLDPPSIPSPPGEPPPVESTATSAATDSVLERTLTVMIRRADGEPLQPLADVQVRVAGSNASPEQTDTAGIVRLAMASDTALTLQLFVASKPTCKLAVPSLRDIDVALRIELLFETVADKRLCKATRLPVTTPELVTH